MLWLLAVVPMLAGAAVLAAGLRRRGVLAAVACTALAATLALALSAAADGWLAVLGWNAALQLRAVLTPLSAMVACLVPAIAIPVLGFAAFHEERQGLGRLLGLLLFFVGAMELLVIADDLLTLLIGWELVGACSWALIGHHWRDVANPASGTYAFLMTRLSDLGMFLAAMAAYAGTGSFAYVELASLDGPLLHVLTFGLVLSAAAKSGQVPFAPWLFRAMAGPTSVSALLHAATMVAAGAYLLARLQPVLAPVAWFAPLVIGVGLATALAGGVVAVLQSHAKKLLAASTSVHFGLMFVAVGAGYPGVAILHLVAHACFKAQLFLSAGIAGERAGGYELAGMRLGRVLPLIAIVSAVGSLALAGVPPLGAAWTKEAIVAAGSAGIWLAIGVILAGGLTAAYAARFQWLAYGLSDERRSGPRPGVVVAATLVSLALASLALSALWLPQTQRATAAWLSTRLPRGPTWQSVLTLLAVATGLLSGRFLALRLPALGQSGPAAAVADWWALPALIRKGLSGPAQALSYWLARFDDVVIDALPQKAALFALRIAGAIARTDARVVDRGVRDTAAFVERLAAVGSRFGESVVDGLPLGSARLVGLSGVDAARLQTGLTHQYFGLLAIAALLLIAIVIAAG